MKKLAECLLQRKTLQNKIDQIARIKEENLFEIKVERISVTDSIDNVTAQVPRVSLSAITAEYDFYAKQLRLIDAAIQQANWTTEIHLEQDCFESFLDAQSRNDKK